MPYVSAWSQSDHHSAAARSKMMVAFMKWALSDGQNYATAMGYAPVPESVVQQELTALGTVKVS